MKLLAKYLIILIAFLFSLFYVLQYKENVKKENESHLIKTEKENFNKRISFEANKVKKLTSNNESYNQKIIFLVDMKIPSNKNRFFVYNLEKNKILNEGLVAHGSGSEKKKNSKGELFFSNVNNSLCTSLGKYEILNSYSGEFGKAYKLKGLDETNNNAYLRNIVLHKYNKVPFEEQNTPICLSYGCPMVNEKFFTILEKLIDKSDKKIILNIYY
ncbi:murein L,D-transpeptidase catalytic domain-containing protein [Flavobacterium terrae]|uniref:L,D-transpeptidase catalytic domain n=1 Tax=Flavobacterium terrae TaxID=415425 RepID=A0A1M6EKL6_9FLAO|nr:murein L,D-transpeptidase catalytic domain family protein [Flavobacterium terrae]SHI85790.1 L,D-transpeptidase catalytic domain [Flavobacterium terrae]